MNSAPQEKNHNFLQKSTFTKFAVCTKKFYEYCVIEGEEKKLTHEKTNNTFQELQTTFSTWTHNEENPLFLKLMLFIKYNSFQHPIIIIPYTIKVVMTLRLFTFVYADLKEKR